MCPEDLRYRDQLLRASFDSLNGEASVGGFPAFMNRRHARRLRYDVAHRVLQPLDDLLPGLRRHVPEA